MVFESNLIILKLLRLLPKVSKTVSLRALPHYVPEKQWSSRLSSIKVSVALTLEMVTEYICSLVSTKLMKRSLGVPQHSNLYLPIYPAIPLSVAKQAPSCQPYLKTTFQVS